MWEECRSIGIPRPLPRVHPGPARDGVVSRQRRYTAVAQSSRSGGSTAQSCAVLARRWPAYRRPIWAWWQRGEEKVAGPLDDEVALLRQVIDSGLACYALTCMGAETYPKRRRRYKFVSWFAGTVVSGFTGVAKPEPQIYQVLLGRFDLDPETTLFIDDREVNVAAAQVGMESSLHTGAEPVLAHLGWVRG